MSRVAILIDGDNISATHAARIAAVGKAAGRVDTSRAYADATNGSGWNAVAGVRLMHAGTGKNAADLLLSIDAVELALTEAFETFVVASSDGDFTHLATRLRDRGHCVIGAGEDKAPKGFRAACTRFEELGAVRETRSQIIDRRHTAPQISKLDQTICRVIGATEGDCGGISLSCLGKALKDDHQICRSDLPGASLKTCLARKKDLYDLFPSDNPERVRLRPGPPFT